MNWPRLLTHRTTSQITSTDHQDHPDQHDQPRDGPRKLSQCYLDHPNNQPWNEGSSQSSADAELFGSSP